MQILRVSRPVILDYPDGQLYRQELNRVVYELTMQIRKFRPQVILAFGPEGGVAPDIPITRWQEFARSHFTGPGALNRYADHFEWLAPAPHAKALSTTAEFAYFQP